MTDRPEMRSADVAVNQKKIYGRKITRPLNKFSFSRLIRSKAVDLLFVTEMGNRVVPEIVQGTSELFVRSARPR